MKLAELTNEQIQNNIESYLDEALGNWMFEDYLKQGRRWYDFVNQWCWHVAHTHDISLHKVAGIVSALSPRNRWDWNLSDAIELIENRDKAKVHTTIVNKKKALAILEGKDIEATLNGLKTVNFYRCIVNPKDHTSVCVDIWMWRAAFADSTLKSKSIHPKEYARIQDAVQAVAAKHTMLPLELQAIVWIVIRDLAQYGQLRIL